MVEKTKSEFTFPVRTYLCWVNRSYDQNEPMQMEKWFPSMPDLSVLEFGPPSGNALLFRNGILQLPEYGFCIGKRNETEVFIFTRKIIVGENLTIVILDDSKPQTTDMSRDE